MHKAAFGVKLENSAVFLVKNIDKAVSINCNINKGVGCPTCNSERKTSFPEYAIVYYLSKYGLEVMHSYKEQGYELDIYIPAKRIAIEYDGYLWHKNKTKQDLEKNYKCAKD